MSTTAWPRNWQGHWIGAEPIPTGVNAEPQFHTTSGGTFTRQLFRRNFTLDEVPRSAPTRLTADSRYQLYVNGIEVGSGPIRSQPRRMRYDTYDIAALLNQGNNCIVVLVTYYGTGNSFWEPAAVNDTLGRAGVLVFEAEIGATTLISDEAWEALDPGAWSSPEHGGTDGVPIEVLDAQELDANWQRGGGEGWQQAHIRPATHLGSLARSQPPTDPYGPLLERPIAVGGGELRRPTSARCAETTEPTRESSPVATVLANWSAPATECSPIETQTRSQHSLFEFDFGAIVAGRFGFTIEAPAGTVVDVLFRERPADPADVFVMSLPQTGLRYITRGDADVFQAKEFNGLRFAQFLVSAPSSDEPISIKDVHVAEQLQPLGEGAFKSSDPELNRLYEAGRRTVQVNASDAYTDCPTREQRAWVGDAVVHQMVTLTTSDDWRMARWYVELAASPRPDGILPMSVAGEVEFSGQHTIPDWSLSWVHGVYLLHLYDPESVDLVRQVLPIARRVLDWYTPYLTNEGALADVPEWNLVDWSSILLSGESSILTAFWARGLREYAQLSRDLGNIAEASWADELWNRVASGFHRFLDEERGCVVDHIVAGVPQAAASQLAGAFAILAGLLSSDQVARAIDWISDPDRLVIRSWIGGAGGYSIEKITDQMKGIQRIDWDEETQVVRAQPFASFWVHEAYEVAGRPELAISAIRDWARFLTDGYDTFGECWGWGTPAHGWSSTPTRDVVTCLVGVKPIAPGFSRVKVAPLYDLADRFEAKVPTPAGMLHIQVGGGEAKVTSPVPGELVLPDGSVRDIDSAGQRF